ncbi:unnamed protein product [Diamesa serratosioi]
MVGNKKSKQFVDMLVFDLKEEIFKHLKVRDLDNVSEISNHSKKGFLNKFDPSVVTQNESTIARDFNDLPNTTKVNIFKGLQIRYQNLTIDCKSNADVALYVNLLTCFGSSMVNLKINKFDLNDVQLIEMIRLPNLESLELGIVSSKILDFIEPSPALTSLNFGFFNETFDDNSINRINNILISTRNSLQELKLSDRVFRNIFDDISNEALTGLQLIHLDITNCDVNSLKYPKNLQTFLNSQSYSLKSLKMSSLTGYEVGEFLNHLDNLEQISIETSYTSSGPELPINNSVIEMDLIGINVTLDLIKPYLDAVPNLETLHVSNLSNQVVRYIIAKNMNNFKKLTYNWSNEKPTRANFFVEKIEI